MKQFTLSPRLRLAVDPSADEREGENAAKESGEEGAQGRQVRRAERPDYGPCQGARPVASTGTCVRGLTCPEIDDREDHL